MLGSRSRFCSKSCGREDLRPVEAPQLWAYKNSTGVLT
jgi:hypothetical protein